MVRRGRVTVCGLTGLAMLAACSSFTGTGPGPGELDAGVGDGAAVESASDGSGHDGGPCRSRSTPTQPCFVSGSCTTSSVSTSVTLPGALTLKEFQGWIWMEVGELKAARMAFKKVLEMDPKHTGATRGSRQLQRKVEEEEKKSSSGLSKFLKR